MSLLARSAAILAGALALLWPAAAMDIQSVRSPGGIEAWLVEEHGLPIISIEAGFDGGARPIPTAGGGFGKPASR
ncbi:MAG: hypothetical protein U1F24_03970 [Alphaproteobacteria bacterium]